MEAYQERVVREKADLDEKLESLQAFLNGIVFETLGLDERIRLRQQLAAMGTYSYVLGERIKAF